MLAKLTSRETAPLLELESHLLQEHSRIESWLRAQLYANPPPFYSSVDLRNAGFKLAPVDTNLFPAGFNNLNPATLPLAVQSVQDAVGRVCPSACHILLIPENHTRNQFYLESLANLTNILEKSGLSVKIGSLVAEETLPIDLPSGRQIVLEPLELRDGHLVVGDFVPCICLLNNDLSDGVPDMLRQAESSLFVPPLELGWASRLKTTHFDYYRKMAAELAGLIGVDPWFIDPLFKSCGEVNFQTREGEECLAENVHELLTAIGKKYKEYGITDKPFVLIKADSGTYGMGIMTVHDPMDVVELNRKQRGKMTKSKGGQQISRVILQEGVYTFETTEEGGVCEPVVYMIDSHAVGGFYRVHTNRGINENLNAPGMHFAPMCFDEQLFLPELSGHPDCAANRFYAYGVIARLAMLAAAGEIRAVLDERQ
jgi:glutamate--cysteine ligase